MQKEAASPGPITKIIPETMTGFCKKAHCLHGSFVYGQRAESMVLQLFRRHQKHGASGAGEDAVPWFYAGGLRSWNHAGGSVPETLLCLFSGGSAKERRDRPAIWHLHGDSQGLQLPRFPYPHGHGAGASVPYMQKHGGNALLRLLRPFILKQVHY